MSSVGRTTRKRRRPTSLVKPRVYWNTPERKRLIEEKDRHGDLDWNQFRDLGLFPDRSARSLQWTYERATEARARRRNGSSASKHPTPPSSLDERQQNKLRRGEEEDDEYEETDSEEEGSDDSEESSSESASDDDESESKNVGATTKHPNGMQSSEKPYPWNITACTPSGPFHISAPAGSSTDIGGPSGSATTRSRAPLQENSSPSGKKARETGLAGKSMTTASQTLFQAAHALQQHESNLNLLEARHESQNSYLKEELDRLRQEIAGMKRRNSHLEKTVEDLKSSRQAETEEALLGRIHERLNDNEELYKERFKEIKHEVTDMKTKEITDIKPGLESVQKRVELLERFFKKLSVFDLLQKFQVEDAEV